MGCLVTSRFEEVGFSSGLLTCSVAFRGIDRKWQQQESGPEIPLEHGPFFWGLLINPEDSGCSSYSTGNTFPNFSPVCPLLRMPVGLRDGAFGCCTAGLLAGWFPPRVMTSVLASWHSNTFFQRRLHETSDQPGRCRPLLLRPAHGRYLLWNGEGRDSKGQALSFFFVKFF